MNDNLQDYYYTKWLYRWGPDADLDGVSALFSHCGDLYRSARRKRKSRRVTRRKVRAYLRESAREV